MTQWTLLDFIFVVVIAVSIAFALLKGLVREIISLAALAGGFILAVFYYRVPASMVSGYTRSESIANFLGFLSIFIGCIILGAVIAFLVNRFVKAASLKWVDRLLGGVFGLLRGWAICSIIVLALIAFPIREDLVPRSALATYMLAGARAAVTLVPRELKDAFNEQYRKVLDSWNRNRGAA
ncbi:MAG: CvpA family protein [Acidobacteria bacterium]|nr:CvpA family protein [Acidobacteriota bacterium]